MITKEISSPEDFREMWASNDPDFQYVLHEDIDASGLRLMNVGPKRFKLCASLGDTITGIEFLTPNPFEGFTGRLVGINFDDCTINSSIFGTGLGEGGLIDSCSFGKTVHLTVYGPEKVRDRLYQANIFVEDRGENTYYRVGIGLDDAANYPTEHYYAREQLVPSHSWIQRASEHFRELLAEIESQ